MLWRSQSKAERARVAKELQDARRERELEEGRLEYLQSETPYVQKLHDDLIALGRRNGFGRDIERAYRIRNAG